MSTLLATANAMHAAGIAVVPLATDGSKRPAVDWKTYQEQAPGSVQLQRWFARPPGEGGYDGLGVLTGPVSGNLELFELEGRAVTDGTWGRFEEAARDHDLGELLERIRLGWMEISPSGGIHLKYRVEGGAEVMLGNTKLARRPGELANTVDVLIETRGRGGFAVAAPSGGRSHPSGGSWTLVSGGPATVATITVEERDALYLLAGLFDQMPVVERAPGEPRRTAAPGTGARPGDDYNARTSWDDILIPRGWTRGRTVGGAIAWIRPGKNARDGISATTGRNDADNLYVFTTSTEFETETPYDKFGAYALLEHGGDIAAAARQLRADGFGSPAEVPMLSLVPPVTEVSRDAFATDGSAALAPAPAAVLEATLQHSDDANGELLVQRFGDVLRHCADRGRWYAWNGVVWEPCPKTAGLAREYAKRVARSLSSRTTADETFKKKSLSAVGISNMLTQAATNPAVSIGYDELDAHPWELNTPGGIVDLRTGTVRPADPDRLHTRLTLCAPDWDASKTRWEEFLNDTFDGDQELIAYMQRLVGYSAVGMVGAHVLPYCHGSGGNGKGVFLETCVKVLSDYATTAPAGFLMAKQYQGHETELARLAGARMVVCSEVNDDDRFDEARVKALTGGDSITARFMQQDHFTFAPTHQLWAMGNHQPGVRAGGPSFWRRLRLIPFVHSVPADKMVDNLQGILAEEHGPAVLAWIIDGAVDYAKGGLRDPGVVLAATGAYERDQDTVSRFLDEMCHVGGAPLVQAKVGIVRSAYESWCREAGDAPLSAKAFGMALQRHGIDVVRTRTARFYAGIALVNDEDSEGDR